MNQIYFQPMINICHVSVIWVPSQPVLLIHFSYFNQFDSVFQPVRFGLCQRHSCICSCFSQSCAISANNICLSFSMKQVHLVAHSFALQSGHLHIWRVPEAHFTKKPWRLRWTGDVLLVHGFPSCSLSHHSSHVHLHFLFFLVPNPSPLHPLHPPFPPIPSPPPPPPPLTSGWYEESLLQMVVCTQQHAWRTADDLKNWKTARSVFGSECQLPAPRSRLAS